MTEKERQELELEEFSILWFNQNPEATQADINNLLANLKYVTQYRLVSEDVANDIFNIKYRNAFKASEEQVQSAIKKIQESGLDPLTNEQLQKLFELPPISGASFLSVLKDKYEYHVTIEDLNFVEKEAFEAMDGDPTVITVARRNFVYKTTQGSNRLNFHFLDGN